MVETCSGVGCLCRLSGSARRNGLTPPPNHQQVSVLAWNLFRLMVDSPARLSSAFLRPADADARQMSGADSEDQALDREPRNLLYEKAFGGGEIQRGKRLGPEFSSGRWSFVVMALTKAVGQLTVHVPLTDKPVLSEPHKGDQDFSAAHRQPSSPFLESSAIHADARRRAAQRHC
jgi:hypothetical protein